MKHIVCYSGGHSSALVAVEVVRKFGKENVILLNHDIHLNIEDADIKRFKNEVAEYLRINITFANMDEWDEKDQFDVCIDAQAFKVGNGSELCTSRLKTMPFMKYLKLHQSEKNCVIYYGFDANETDRIQRRSSILGLSGYMTDYPLALWSERTIASTREIGVEPPLTYGVFKHANCVGCLKAGKQHWYCVYMIRPDIWEKAKLAEEKIGYAIIKRDTYIEDLEPLFKNMEKANIEPTERIHPATFWASVKKSLKLRDQKSLDIDSKPMPCECVF